MFVDGVGLLASESSSSRSLPGSFQWAPRLGIEPQSNARFVIGYSGGGRAGLTPVFPSDTVDRARTTSPLLQ